MGPDSDSRAPGASSGSGENLKIIDLEFETLRQFREVMAPRLSYDGFFIATNDPLPRGTPARFRFLLPDGFVLAEGSGVVAWSRYEDEGPDLKAGMALLFGELAHQSREIIDELIDFHIATGGDPFDLGPRASEAGDIGTDALGGEALEVTRPVVSEPGPDDATVESAAADRFLPDWLSEVAQQHAVDLSPDATIPIGDRPALVEVPEEVEPVQQDFEISLMPADEGPEPMSFEVSTDTMPDITMTPSDERPPRDLRLRLVVPAVAVLIAISGLVFWLANRDRGAAPHEAAVAVEEIDAAEPIENEDDGPPAEQGWESAAAPEVVEEPTVAIEEIAEPVGPASRLLLVAATRAGGGTVVTARGNGELSEDTVRVSLLENPARVWVRIQGIETFYRPNDIPVGSPEVERVRVGHHPEETPQSIYVVIDLADAAAVVREHTVEGDTLRVVVARP